MSFRTAHDKRVSSPCIAFCKLEERSAHRAESTLVYRMVRVSFCVYYSTLFRVNDYAAAKRAIRTYGQCPLCTLDLELKLLSVGLCLLKIESWGAQKHSTQGNL